MHYGTNQIPQLHQQQFQNNLAAPETPRFIELPCETEQLQLEQIDSLNSAMGEGYYYEYEYEYEYEDEEAGEDGEGEGGQH